MEQQKRKKRVTFNLPAWLDNLLEVLCNDTGEPKNEFFETAMRNYLGRRKAEMQQANTKLRAALKNLPAASS